MSGTSLRPFTRVLLLLGTAAALGAAGGFFAAIPIQKAMWSAQIERRAAENARFEDLMERAEALLRATPRDGGGDDAGGGSDTTDNSDGGEDGALLPDPGTPRFFDI